jgi:hypothetical protein
MLVSLLYIVVGTAAGRSDSVAPIQQQIDGT